MIDTSTGVEVVECSDWLYYGEEQANLFTTSMEVRPCTKLKIRSFTFAKLYLSKIVNSKNKLFAISQGQQYANDIFDQR